MGIESSKLYLNFEIPSSLRSINPFLQLAQQLLLYVLCNNNYITLLLLFKIYLVFLYKNRNIHNDSHAQSDVKLKKLTISCINRAFNVSISI